MLNNKRHVRIAGVVAALIIGASVFVNFSQAQEIKYNLLAPLPGGANQVSGDQAFATYAPQLFAFALSAAAVLAFVMVVVGGIQYLSSAESPSRLQDAKDRIWNALIGLVLAVAAWLILSTLNPALVSNDFTLPSLGSGIPSEFIRTPTSCNDAKQKCIECVSAHASDKSVCDTAPECINYGGCIATPPAGWP